MTQVVIENPIINSPFEEPKRHFRFSDEGITNEIVEGRRVSSYFVPIPKPKARGKTQLVFDTEWTQERVKEKGVYQSGARTSSPLETGRSRRRYEDDCEPAGALEPSRAVTPPFFLPNRSP
jgi:hypothetical protein